MVLRIKHAVWLLPGTLAFIAILSLLVRLFLPYIDVYRDEILGWVEQAVDARVNVAEIKVEMHGYAPVIQLSDVSVSKDGYGQDMRFASLQLKINLLDSLAQKKIVIRNLYAKDGVLTVVRNADGEIVSMLPWSPGDKQQGFNLQFENLTLTWEDLLLSQKHVFQKVDLTVNLKQGKQHVIFSSQLSQALGKQLSFGAMFEGELSQPETWQGHFKLKAEEMNMENWQSLVAMDTNYAGIVSLEMHGQVDRQRLVRAGGRLACRQCLFGSDETVDLSTTFSWDHGQEVQKLLLSDVSVKTPTLNLSQFLIAGRKYVHQDDIELAVQVPKFQHDQLEAVSRYAGYSAESLPLVASSGSLSLVVSLPLPKSLSSNRQELVAQFLDQYDWRQINSAHLALTSGEGFIHLPEYFEGDINYDRMDVSARFLHHDSESVLVVDDISLRIDEAILHGKMGWSGHLDEPADIFVAIDGADFPLESVTDWVPVKFLNPAFGAWLKQAFVSGTMEQGELELAGNMNDFPFLRGNGHFSWSASVKDMEMNYRSDSEPLERVKANVVFNHGTLIAAASELKYSGLHSNHTRVQINNVLSPVVEVNGGLEGPLEKVFEYVKRKGLVDDESFLIRNINFDGECHLDISAIAGLSKKINKPLQVHGVLQFKQSTFSVPSLDIELNKINGNLGFDHNGGYSETLELIWQGEKLTAGAKSVDGSTVLSFRGNLSLADLSRPIMQEAPKFAKGSSDWQIDVTVPNLSKTKASPGLFSVRLQSDLEGIALDLPSPFKKIAAQTQPVNLLISTKELGSDYQFSYGGLLKGRLKEGAKGYTGYVHFGENDKPAVKGGILVSGHIDESVIVDEWFDLITKDGGESAYVFDMNLTIADLLMGNKSLGQAAITLDNYGKNKDRWKASLNSSDIAGEINVSKHKDEIEFKADIQRLLLKDKKMLQAFGNDKQADSLPKSEILIKQFQYGNIHGKNLVLLLSPIQKGTRVDRMRMDIGDIILVTEGEWQQTGLDVRSIFDVSVSGKNYGEFFTNWEITSDLDKGKGRLSGRLSWPGSPKEFGFDTMRGNIHVDLKDGSIKKIEPGMGRVLGLLNIGTIARHLAFDFKSLFKQGLSFDTITANLEFKGGDMYTTDFSLMSPSMKMLLKGRTGIKDKDYDQQVEVTPDLSASLPVAGAIAGGPLAGLSVYLINKLTNLGDQINNAAILHYQVTGTWDQPKIKLVKSEIAERIKGPLRLLIKTILPKQARPQEK